MDYSRPELADRLAADYVAGTLRGPARRRFESLLVSHPALRRSVADWQLRLMPLTQTVAPVPPPPAVWSAIEARLDGRPVPARAAERPAPASAAATLAGEFARWRERLAFWRGLSAVAGTAAVVLATLLVVLPAPVQPPIIVVLTPTVDGAPSAVTPASFVVSIGGDRRSVVARPVSNVEVQSDRVLQLWAAAGRGAPRSVGLISANDATVVRRAQLPAGTDHLAVSLEPPGGSPTGRPTGPVLYYGTL